MKHADLNDRLQAGTLPEDPFADGEVVSNEVPRFVTVRDGLADALKRATSKVKHEFGTFAHAKIDEALGGLRPGTVTLIAADSSFGKSSWAVAICDENIKRGKRVMVVSAEDPESMYTDRLMRRRARIPGLAQQHRRFTSAHHQAMADVVARAEAVPFFVDASGFKLEKLLKLCREFIVEHNIEIVIFDYLNVFDCALNHKDRVAAIEYIFTEIRTMVRHAKRGGVAGIAMAQLTWNDQKDAEPGKYAVRGSKGLTQGAENVLIGHVAREDKTSKTGELIWQAGDRVVLFGKIKEGDGTKVGKYVRMNWNEEVACFDAVREHREPEPADRFGKFDNE